MTRILVIDDNEAVRSSVAFLLAAAGFEVVSAANGREGLQRCDESQPHLVITDIMMPDIDGIEVMLTLRATYGTIPILAISGGWGAGRAHLLDMVSKLGATETLAKPFEADDLFAAINQCLKQGSRSAGGNRPGKNAAGAAQDRLFAYTVRRHARARLAGQNA